MRHNDSDAIETTAEEPHTSYYDPREHTDDLSDDDVAQQLGYESLDDAPRIVQNTIENRDISIEDPHAFLRRGDG